MPINSTITIKGSVGRRGINNLNDVRTIQTRLNDLMRPPRSFLTVDGRCGPMTENAIADFQRVVRGAANPDARVDPGQQTLRALNDPASEGKWAQMSIGAPATASPAVAAGGVAYPANVTAHEKKVIDALAASTKNPAELGVLNELLSSAFYGHVKSGFNALGVIDEAAQFGASVRGMLAQGSTSAEIVKHFRDAANLRQGRGFKDLLKLMKDRPTLGASIKKLGTKMNAVSLLFCAAEVTNHLNMKRYGSACAEIYGTVMGMLVPWAGLVSGLQELVYAYSPALRGQSAVNYFFRLLNAADPIGLGKIGVDSVVTLIETAMSSYQRGSLDMRHMEMLVDRMNKTPASILAGWGTKIGDVAYDALNTPGWWGNTFFKW